jgi:hypothetical protein
MPVPLIAGAAAAVAARLAAKKAAQELAKKAVKKTVVKAASKNVKVKPAAKPVGNTRNSAKELDGVANSFYRASNPYTGIEDGVRSAGKSRAGRVANSKLSKKTVKSAKEPARRPTPDGRSPFSYKTIEINSAPKKTADSARAANAKALKAANKPVSKNNRNIGGPVMRNVLKNSAPARANRTRAGNPAKKK